MVAVGGGPTPPSFTHFKSQPSSNVMRTEICRSDEPFPYIRGNKIHNRNTAAAYDRSIKGESKHFFLRSKSGTFHCYCIPGRAYTQKSSLYLSLSLCQSTVSTHTHTRLYTTHTRDPHPYSKYVVSSSLYDYPHHYRRVVASSSYSNHQISRAVCIILIIIIIMIMIIIIYIYIYTLICWGNR